MPKALMRQKIVASAAVAILGQPASVAQSPARAATAKNTGTT